MGFAPGLRRKIMLQNHTNHPLPVLVSLPITMANVTNQPSPQPGRTVHDLLHGAVDSCIVVDVETTGLDPEQERIIEVGALWILNGEVRSTFHSLVNPQRELPEFIHNLTGLDDRALQQAPEMSAVLPRLHSFITEAIAQSDASENSTPNVVGHNVAFDLSFILAEAQRCQATGWEILHSSQQVCTAASARELVERDAVGRYRLQNVAEYFSTPHRPSHRALDDVHATFEVLLGLDSLSRRHPGLN